MDFNNIESLLQSGVNAEDIAKAFTDELNSAIKETNKVGRKKELCNALAEDWNDLMLMWLENNDLPDGLENDDFFMDAELVETLFDAMMNGIVKMAPIYRAIDEIAKTENKNKASVSTNTDGDFNSIMRNFLNSIE